MVLGTARRSEPPFTPGVAAVGVVERPSEAAPSLEVGKRVVYWNPLHAAFAEFAAVPAWRTVQGTTAHYLATDSYALGPDSSCLVYAAAGGVGHLLVQVAKLKDARVLAVVRNEGKTAPARWAPTS